MSTLCFLLHCRGMQRLLTALAAFALLLLGVPASVRAQTPSDIPAGAVKDSANVGDPDAFDVLPPNPSAEDLAALAAPIPDEYMRGEVESIVDRGTREVEGFVQHYQTTKVRITSGPEKGRVVTIEHAESTLAGTAKAAVGDKVVVTKVTVGPGDVAYYMSDRWRLPAMGWLLAAFLVLILVLARWKGLRAVFGLALSILTIGWFVVPAIVAGHNPILVSLVAAVGIMVVSLYTAHGVSVRTSVALGSTALTFGLAMLVAHVAVRACQLFGLGSDDTLSLSLGAAGDLNLRGLLLGGIMLGTLGVLDDITTAQAAVVDELRSANPALRPVELYRRAISVGREHISSLVNTLFLAYAGAALPLFLAFAVNRTQPLWVIINSETIAEEAVRSLVGSITLALAVPITTGIAAYVIGRRPPSSSPTGHYSHTHH
jgi:uncharacterized membrane protein